MDIVTAVPQPTPRFDFSSRRFRHARVSSWLPNGRAWHDHFVSIHIERAIRWKSQIAKLFHESRVARSGERNREFSLPCLRLMFFKLGGKEGSPFLRITKAEGVVNLYSRQASVRWSITRGWPQLIRSILTIDRHGRVPFVSCWAGHRTAPSSKTARVTPIIPDSNTKSTFRALSIACRAMSRTSREGQEVSRTPSHNKDRNLKAAN
jgi:hypothetical protein